MRVIQYENGAKTDTIQFLKLANHDKEFLVAELIKVHDLLESLTENPDKYVEALDRLMQPFPALGPGRKKQKSYLSFLHGYTTKMLKGRDVALSETKLLKQFFLYTLGTEIEFVEKPKQPEETVFGKLFGE